jgi:GAF domain-containing protein/HAMP domain-containing protein
LDLEPAFRQVAFLNPNGIPLAQMSRLSSTLSAQFKNQFRGDVLTVTEKAERFVSPIYIDSSTSEPLTLIAVPVRNAFGDFQGVLVAELNVKFMWDLVDQLRVGDTGYAYVVDNQGNLIAFGDIARVLSGENIKGNYEVQEFLQNPSEAGDVTPTVTSYTGLTGKTVVGYHEPLGTPSWAVVVELPTTEAYQPITKYLQLSMATILAFAILAGLAGVALARRLAAPLIDLSSVASEIAGGNLGLQAKVGGPAEIANVATTFNTMTSQLREMIGSLEQRVADRTRDLATVAEVSTATSTILETKRLLQEVVDLTKERFHFYHSHIYLLDDAGSNLVLASGAGEPGRLMVAEGRSIPFDREQSLVARAARERNGVTVNDVTQAPDFLPNPLLPDTRSELAVPMIVGDKVIGVFDVQSDQIGRFTEADINIQTTLASQVAVALQNVRQYEDAQRTSAQLSEALDIARLANWEYDVARDRFIFNDHFYSIFRTTAEREGGYELSSADYAERLVHPDDLPMVGAAIEKALASTDKHYRTQLEHRILYRDGSGTGYISVEVHIERDDQGRILRYYGANQDITERKVLQGQLAQRARQQESINLITQRIQAAPTIEEAMQVAARELGYALGQKQTLVSLESGILNSEHEGLK